MTGVPRPASASRLWICFALSLAACATEVGGGSPGSGGGQAGTAGATGAGGTAGGGGGTTGTAGAAGTAGAGGVSATAGSTGRGGATATAGSTGAVGAAGTGGATGAAGAAGTAGASGTAGRGGTTGTAGSSGAAGRGGATGGAGSTGRGGTTGTAGSTGSGGAGAGPVNLNGRKALLVVDNTGSLDDGEIILRLTLENRGMIVTLSPGTGPATLANGQNVVLVSSGVGSGDFVPVFKDVAVPMVVFGNSAYQNLGWITSSSGKGTVESTTLVSLVDTSSPLVSDLMTGAGFKMILDSRDTSLYWGTPTASAIRAASIMGQPTQAVSFGYEKGAALMTGTAAARRIGFGVKVDSVQDLTVEGFKLLMAAIEWTAGAN
jgi:hypothetical protein